MRIFSETEIIPGIARITMKGLILEEIEKMEAYALSPGERAYLVGLRRKTFTRLAIPYFGLTCVIIYILVGGARGRAAEVLGDDKDYSIVAPWYCAFSYLLLNVYFAFLFRKYVFPLIRDIKKGTKHILFLRLEKRDPVFNRYFIYTPVIKCRQLEISGDDYYRLKGLGVQLMVAPHSLHILGLVNEGRAIKFHLRDDF